MFNQQFVTPQVFSSVCPEWNQFNPVGQSGLYVM